MAPIRVDYPMVCLSVDDHSRVSGSLWIGRFLLVLPQEQAASFGNLHSLCENCH